MPEPSPSSPEEAKAWKDALYSKFQRPLDWRQRLEQLATYKALDIPMENDRGINTRSQVDARTFTGVGWKELLIMALVAAAPVGLFLWQDSDDAPSPPAAVQSEFDPLLDREYEIIFRDEDGRRIEVPRWPPSTED